LGGRWRRKRAHLAKGGRATSNVTNAIRRRKKPLFVSENWEIDSQFGYSPTQDKYRSSSNSLRQLGEPPAIMEVGKIGTL
jgi:hypothetical protein